MGRTKDAAPAVASALHSLERWTIPIVISCQNSGAEIVNLWFPWLAGGFNGNSVG